MIPSLSSILALVKFVVERELLEVPANQRNVRKNEVRHGVLSDFRKVLLRTLVEQGKHHPHEQ